MKFQSIQFVTDDETDPLTHELIKIQNNEFKLIQFDHCYFDIHGSILVTSEVIKLELLYSEVDVRRMKDGFVQIQSCDNSIDVSEIYTLIDHCRLFTSGEKIEDIRNGVIVMQGSSHVTYTDNLMEGFFMNQSSEHF